MWERNDDRTKASFGVGKSMTKTKGSLRSQRSIIEIHSLNGTVLMNERSIEDRGRHRGRKGASNDRNNRNNIILKKE